MNLNMDFNFSHPSPIHWHDKILPLEHGEYEEVSVCIAIRWMRAFLKSTDHKYGEKHDGSESKFHPFFYAYHWIADAAMTSAVAALRTLYEYDLTILFFFLESFVCLKMTTTFSCWIICHKFHKYQNLFSIVSTFASLIHVLWRCHWIIDIIWQSKVL